MPTEITFQEKLFPQLEAYIKKIDLSGILEERKKVLQYLIDFIQEKTNNGEAIRLNFICTHNSRRSHLTQIWAQTLAGFCQIPNVQTYSGGTEATALFPMVAKTLESSGFQVEKLSGTENPLYCIKYGPDVTPIIGFSKPYNHVYNPQAKFAAIMTCSEADANCPLVIGAAKRIRITYEDPKNFDNTHLQVEKYKERSLQIATELFYVFSKIT